MNKHKLAIAITRKQEAIAASRRRCRKFTGEFLPFSEFIVGIRVKLLVHALSLLHSYSCFVPGSHTLVLYVKKGYDRLHFIIFSTLAR